MEQGINLVSLRVKNFLSISDVEIKPKHITQIVGANNNGKTSLLKAIEIGLKGSTDGSLVKVGETQAEIILEFSDGLTVHRKINASGTQSVRASKNEMEAKSPQTLLSSLFDTSAFNPLELLEPKRRVEAILQAIPVRVTEAEMIQELASPVPLPPVEYNQHGIKVLDALHNYFYNRRSEANRKAKEEVTRHKYEEEQSNPNEPEAGKITDEQADQQIGAFDAEVLQINQEIGKHNNKVHALSALRTQIQKEEKEVSALETQLFTAKSHLNMLKENEQKASAETQSGESFQTRLDEINEMKLTLSGDKLKNAALRAWTQQRSGVYAQQKRADEANEFAAKLDQTVEAIRKLQPKILNKGKMPVSGLTYDEGKFLFEGFPVENLSTSQAMKLACGLARALAKKTKVICLDGAEALDEVSYVTLKQEISGDGYNYFITKVGEPFKSSDQDAVVEMSNGDARVIQ